MSNEMLEVDEELGIAHHAGATAFAYGDSYIDRYVALEGTPIARKVNSHRMGMVGNRLPILDIGIGSGEFLRRTLTANPTVQSFGYDIAPKAESLLKGAGLWFDPFSQDPNAVGIKSFTCWDSLEHMESPEDFLRLIPVGCWLFCTLPIFDSLQQVIGSKHFKPREHLWYWTRVGFCRFLERNGFGLREISEGEVDAGREGVASFSAVKLHDNGDKWPAIKLCNL